MMRSLYRHGIGALAMASVVAGTTAVAAPAASAQGTGCIANGSPTNPTTVQVTIAEIGLVDSENLSFQLKRNDSSTSATEVSVDVGIGSDDGGSFSLSRTERTAVSLDRGISWGEYALVDPGFNANRAGQTLSGNFYTDHQVDVVYEYQAYDCVVGLFPFRQYRWEPNDNISSAPTAPTNYLSSSRSTPYCVRIGGNQEHEIERGVLFAGTTGLGAAVGFDAASGDLGYTSSLEQGSSHEIIFTNNNVYATSYICGEFDYPTTQLDNEVGLIVGRDTLPDDAKTTFAVSQPYGSTADRVMQEHDSNNDGTIVHGGRMQDNFTDDQYRYLSRLGDNRSGVSKADVERGLEIGVVTFASRELKPTSAASIFAKQDQTRDGFLQRGGRVLRAFSASEFARIAALHNDEDGENPTDISPRDVVRGFDLGLLEIGGDGYLQMAD